MLGVDDNVLKFWRTVHRQWQWVAGKIKGNREQMRLTG